MGIAGRRPVPVPTNFGLRLPLVDPALRDLRSVSTEVTEYRDIGRHVLLFDFPGPRSPRGSPSDGSPVLSTASDGSPILFTASDGSPIISQRRTGPRVFSQRRTGPRVFSQRRTGSRFFSQR